MTKSIKMKTLAKEINDIISATRHEYRFYYYVGGYELRDLTVVTKLDKDNDHLIVAFSFCNPKDIFTKNVGKVECIKRIRDYLNPKAPTPKYVTSVPINGVPKHFRILIAYDKIQDKPRYWETVNYRELMPRKVMY